VTPEWAQWLSMALLAVTAAAVVTRPWWRRGNPGVQARRAANISAYRTRIAELAAEREAGLLSAAEAQALEMELGARLLIDAEELPIPSAVAAAESPSRRWSAVALAAVALMLFAGLWYGLGSSWRTQREIASADAPAPISPEVAAMIEQLAQKLQAQPNNLEGWAMLGRSYFATQRYAQAAQAYAEANQRLEAGGQPADPDWLVGQGEAIAFADGEQIPPDAAALFERALALSPDDGKALWYGGLAAAQSGRFPQARARWTALLQLAGLPDSMRGAVQDRLQTLDSGSAAADPDPTTASAIPSASPVSLHVKVSLAPSLAAKVPAGATLFMFAKAASGPPIPLAVRRLPGATLPMTLDLDDSMAMAPQLKLSQFDRYVVTARLTTSGGAMAQSGDLQGSVELDRSAAGRPVELRIDAVVP
jgi:cytochrome c-type biogenesis protein CcmH